MHITSTLSAGFLNFLLMHFLDYNNVGGVRWTSISELCIIEMNPLLAPHANTITQPNHFSFALDYDTVSSSYLETASRINRRQIDPHNNSLRSLWRERWNKPSWNGAPPPYPTSIHCHAHHHHYHHDPPKDCGTRTSQGQMKNMDHLTYGSPRFFVDIATKTRKQQTHHHHPWNTTIPT